MAWVEDPYRQYNLDEHHGNRIAVWLADGIMPKKARYFSVSAHDLKFFQSVLSVWYIDNTNIAVEWELPSGAENRKTLTSLWGILAKENQVFRAFWGEHSDKLIASPRPVYIEKTGGGPFGKYVAELVSRRDRAHGLFIQAYGHRNLNPCEQCVNRYRRSFLHIDLDPGDFRLVHALWPFVECVSLPGYKGGTCGNCAFQLDGTCSFEDDHCPEFAQSWRAEDCESEDGLEDQNGTFLLEPRKWSRDKTPRSLLWEESREDLDQAKEVRKNRYPSPNQVVPRVALPFCTAFL